MTRDKWCNFYRLSELDKESLSCHICVLEGTVLKLLSEEWHEVVNICRNKSFIGTRFRKGWTRLVAVQLYSPSWACHRRGHRQPGDSSHREESQRRRGQGSVTTLLSEPGASREPVPSWIRVERPTAGQQQVTCISPCHSTLANSHTVTRAPTYSSVPMTQHHSTSSSSSSTEITIGLKRLLFFKCTFCDNVF